MSDNAETHDTSEELPFIKPAGNLIEPTVMLRSLLWVIATPRVTRSSGCTASANASSTSDFPYLMQDALRWGKIAMVAGGALLIGSSSCQLARGEPNKVLYELQERCGKEAAQTFEREWGATGIVNTKDGQMLAGYENHYSPRFNKCFYLQIVTTYQTAKGKTTSRRSLRLFDLHENKEYGTFSEQFDCEVRGTFCRTETEWQDLVKPFMEE